MFQNLNRSLASDQTLKIQCDACDHLATLPAAKARTLCGSDATPMDIRRRARCIMCRTPGRARVWI